MAIYFVSDVHLGLQYRDHDPAMVEERFYRWLRSIEDQCEELYLVGDIFDFWFEWKRVVPKGFVRILGQLGLMGDRGIRIHWFAGNHDMWLSDYFVREIGAQVYTEPRVVQIQGRQVMIGHGDNLGQRSLFARFLGSLFRNRPVRWLFSRLFHPDWVVRVGMSWSRSRRNAHENVAITFREESESIVRYIKESGTNCDLYIFGHLHTPIIYELDEQRILAILGEWIVRPMVGRMEDGAIDLVEV